MGFTRNASIKAAIETGKSGGVEAAAEWVMLRLDDPSLNDPPATATSHQSASGPAHMEGLDELIAFGKKTFCDFFFWFQMVQFSRFHCSSGPLRS